ncbi:4-deoxy-4-formamido-L-arabinose-phosphoundecaprenol deformylase, partial [Citrobacter freundii]
AQEGMTFCPLSELLSGSLPLGQVVRGNIAGREGWLGCQQIAGSR